MSADTMTLTMTAEHSRSSSRESRPALAALARRIHMGRIQGQGAATKALVGDAVRR